MSDRILENRSKSHKQYFVPYLIYCRMNNITFLQEIIILKMHINT